MNHRNKRANVEYEFTKDWFSMREPSWWKNLSHLSKRASRALEIGSLEGRSAVWALENLLVDENSELFCIDLFSDREVESRFDSNILKTGESEKVRKLKGNSWEHLRNLEPASYDLIYVDGAHHGLNVLEDAVLCFRLLRREGFLIFDDYPWANDKSFAVYPKDAIDAFLYLYQEKFIVIEKNWQVILKLKA